MFASMHLQIENKEWILPMSEGSVRASPRQAGFLLRYPAVTFKPPSGGFFLHSPVTPDRPSSPFKGDGRSG